MPNRIIFAIIFMMLILLASPGIIQAVELELPELQKDRSLDEIPVNIVTGEEDRLYIYYEAGGFYDRLEYWVTARGGVGRTYRTAGIWMELKRDGLTSDRLTFTSSDLQDWSPDIGVRKAAYLVITRDHIVQAIQDQIGGEFSEAAIAESYFTSFNEVSIGAMIEVVEGGAVHDGPYDNVAEIFAMLGSEGFIVDNHRDDIEARFQIRDLLGTPYPVVSTRHILVEPAPGWGELVFEGNEYAWVSGSCVDYYFFLPPVVAIDTPFTTNPSVASEYNTSADYEFLCSAITYNDESIGSALNPQIEELETRTVTPAVENPLIQVRYYYLEKEPELPDFEVSALAGGTGLADPGTRYTGTVSYRLKNTVSSPVEARLFLTANGMTLHSTTGANIHNTVYTFDPGETKTFNFSWIAPGSGLTTIIAEIWPTEPAALPRNDRDEDPSDNERQISVPTQAIAPPPAPPPSLPPSDELMPPSMT